MIFYVARTPFRISNSLCTGAMFDAAPVHTKRVRATLVIKIIMQKRLLLDNFAL